MMADQAVSVEELLSSHLASVQTRIHPLFNSQLVTPDALKSMGKTVMLAVWIPLD